MSNAGVFSTADLAPLYYWAGAVAVVFIFVVFWWAAGRSETRRRRFVRIRREREVIHCSEMKARYYPHFVGRERVLEAILEVAADAWGMDHPGRLRPDDPIKEDYGLLQGVVLDDEVSVFVEKLCKQLESRFAIRWIPGTSFSSSMTLGNAIEEIMQIPRVCRQCGRGIEENSCRCVRCGEEVEPTSNAD